jgi:hypothetical protein
MSVSQTPFERPAESPASLEGLAVKLGTGQVGQVVWRATVLLNAVEGASPFTLTATTDASGKFSFSSVPPGRYRVLAAREGYVTSEFGQRAPGRFPSRERYDLYRVASTDASGHVRIDGVAPGEYKVFAWDDVKPGAWQYPDFLRLHEDRGTPVRIREGSAEKIDLRLIPTPR